MRISHLLVFIISIFSLSSCMVNRYIAPPFTDLDKILQLKPGMTVSEVTKVLRIQPYDIIHAHESGSKVLMYNYRVKDRNMSIAARAAQPTIHGEDGQRQGENWYNNNYRELFLTFQNDTLKSIYGERVFSEGVYLELIEDRIGLNPTGKENGQYLFSKDEILLQGAYQERTGYKTGAQVQEDEAVKKRRKTLTTIGAVLLGLLGIISLGG